MLDVPHEIWLNIAQFVHPSDMEHLMGVNSTFYDIGMDARYRQMSFSFLDTKMLRNIVRLRDPVVAKRVRILHVYPAFLKQSIDRKENIYHEQRSLRFRFTAWASQVLEPKQMAKTKFRIIQQLRTVDDLVQIMFDVFKGLPNVVEYHIMWSGLQPIIESPVRFLSVVFRCNLRKLALDISLENVVDLLAPHCAPLNIEELDLIIRADHSISASGHALIMINHLAPAIIRLKSSLRKLTIQAWEPLNFSPLFCSLVRLPLLHHLTLGIPIEAPHLGDPLGLGYFLNTQSPNLTTLSLRVTQYSGPGLTHAHMSIDNWIVKALDRVHITHLKNLEISSSLFPPTAAFACLAQFSATITSLVLTGCYQTLADVAGILGAFRGRPRAQRLETLRLGSVILTPELLDLLSEELPNLHRLELLVREVAAHSDECLLTYRHKPAEQIDYFVCEMEKRSYPHWNLRSLKILLTTIPYHFPYGPHLEQLLAACVPSIEGCNYRRSSYGH